MALLPGAADPAILALARNALARLWARGARGPLVVRAHALEQLHLAAPHPVFDLTLDDVVAGRGLESAHRCGLRLLVLAGDRAVAAVELVPGPGPLPVVHLQLGDLPEANAVALRSAESLAPVLARDHELRLLRISALHLLAVWAHGESDILVPLAPAPHGLVAGSPGSPEALLGALREPARALAGFRYHP